MRPWYLIGAGRLTFRDRVRLLLGVPLWVRFDSPDGECHAACRVSARVGREMNPEKEAAA